MPMKRDLLTVFILIFSMSVAGTQDISTCQELQSINDLDEDYVLTGNIECKNIESFEPIGDYYPDEDESDAFTGTLDGRNHVISNLRINEPDQTYVGLFSGLGEDARVKDVKIVDSTVIGKSEVGGIAGRNDHGSIRYVGYEGKVSGQRIVGGITGWNWGTVDQTYTTGTVEGQEVVGGVAGKNFASKVVASYSTSNISGEQGVGGVIGSNLGTSTQAFELFAGGPIEGSSQAGGIAGHDNSYGIQKSYWDKITTSQDKTAFNNEFTERGALSTDQMTGDEAVESMNGFEFGSTWGEPAEGRYPYLNAIQSEGIEPVEISDSQGEDETNSENDENNVQETGNYDIQISYGDNFENGVGSLRFTTLQSNSNEPKRGKWKLYDGRTEEGDILAESASGTLNWETLIYREEYCEDQSNLENRCEDSESKFPKGPGWYTVKFTPADSMPEKTKSFETENREESTQNENSEENEENPTGTNTIDLVSERPLSTGEDIELEVTVDQNLMEKGYKLMISGPGDFNEEIKNQQEVSFTASNTGEYHIKLMPTGLGGNLPLLGSLLEGDALYSIGIDVGSDEPLWKQHCSEMSYSSDEIASQVNCIQNEIIPNYFQDTTGSNPEVAESLCQDLLDYSYSQDKNRCQ